jgi:HK97 gp10 family phage protein
MADDGGLSRIQRRLNAIPKRLKERMGAVAVEEAEKIAADMKAFAEASRDTGDLIDSITVTGPGQVTPPYSQPGGMTKVSDTGAMITAGNEEVRYPHLVEYGTDTAPAQPFFWPAVDLNKRKVQLRLRREARKAVREQWGKK